MSILTPPTFQVVQTIAQRRTQFLRLILHFLLYSFYAALKGEGYNKIYVLILMGL